jgi:hypothetical protein
VERAPLHPDYRPVAWTKGIHHQREHRMDTKRFMWGFYARCHHKRQIKSLLPDRIHRNNTLKKFYRYNGLYPGTPDRSFHQGSSRYPSPACTICIFLFHHNLDILAYPVSSCFNECIVQISPNNIKFFDPLRIASQAAVFSVIQPKEQD